MDPRHKQARRPGWGSRRAEAGALGTVEEEPLRQGPLWGEEKGDPGEARRHELETACPQQGKEQDCNILQRTGGAQGQRRERRLCASSGPPL